MLFWPGIKCYLKPTEQSPGLISNIIEWYSLNVIAWPNIHVIEWYSLHVINWPNYDVILHPRVGGLNKR
jgi:hypothetical protein